MKKLTYAEHCRLAYLFGFKPRNPISFLIWKIKHKKVRINVYFVLKEHFMKRSESNDE